MWADGEVFLCFKKGVRIFGKIGNYDYIKERFKVLVLTLKAF
jgi:hypothetical protein